MNNTQPLLSARGLVRHYGNHRAIDGISLEIQPGEVLGLLGPNGAGKSTTLGLLSGSLAPSAGEIIVAGIDLLENPKQAKRHIGYLPEHPPLYDDLSVDEYLRYSARLRGVHRVDIPGALQHVKQRTGLEEAGRAMIGTLSKGFRQRVGIAQALVHQPKVIILDEPTVGLDPLQIREIRALIRDLSTKHGVILSTHILAEVQAVCDRVHIINHGITVFTDSLINIMANDQENTLFAAFGLPPNIEELCSIPGIRHARALGGGRFRLDLTGDNEQATTVAAAACAGGWKLYELHNERQSLEQIFLQAVYDETRDEIDT